ncbi:predicted protein [Micromonas commoda]|uniref:DNA-directed RNA polymerases I, II, and III subunit RPABC3 n=1 Tax=Micromonas commoda (strain RCC299 / NOUM17 / CCMP2709) TaxID=296587 RepID=C1DYQ6_MICCC|nr:predicted protein [Micromonas commoda]ACO61470.1 predicted protein [Micromonas commoda]|eukprot:XP_002500212.1 predicted protein [Micromonas commoda]
MAPAVSGSVIAYEDIFEVIDRDPDGKKFDKVSRFRCRSQFEADLEIDINVDIYKLDVGTRFTLVLSPTLSLDGTPEDPSYDQTGKETLASSYDYVMYGKVFKKEDENAGGIQKTTVIASFGGLLMRIKADPKNLQEVDIDNRVYVLIRKIA